MLSLKLLLTICKYFTEFYSSDIILTSNYGFGISIGDELKKKVGAQFSLRNRVENGACDGCAGLLMQNWDYLEHIFKHINFIH